MDETWVTKICFWARFELYMREENDIQTSWQKFLNFRSKRKRRDGLQLWGDLENIQFQEFFVGLVRESHEN